jgi:predicted DNA-binding protein (MmcQ/YjbR family)
MGQESQNAIGNPFFIHNVVKFCEETSGKRLFLGMDLTQLQTWCMSFPHATEDIKWEHDLCFSIGGKMFLVTSPDELPTSASFKVADEEFEEYAALPGCKPAPYLARHKWILISDISQFQADELKRLARQSYDLVKAKLPKKILNTLGG